MFKNLEEANFRILGVGLDESNHAEKVHGNRPTKGEIIVATFSFYETDMYEECQSSRREYSKVEEWLRAPDRDWRYTVLPFKEASGGSNLHRVIIPLLEDYLNSLSIKVPEIRSFFDGPLRKRERTWVKKELTKIVSVEKSSAKGFVKKRYLTNRKRDNGGNSVVKRPQCTYLVYAADVLASQLLKEYTTPQKLFGNDKFVPLKEI